MPEVSVVVPTYDRAHTLRASLASLFAQEGVDFEVVVVDDGSTDGTAALLGTIADPRLRVVAGPHRGIAAARNAGVAVARAPLIAFHDSDDEALPGRLAVPVAYLRVHPEVHLVIQNGRLLPPEDATGGQEEPWVRPAVALTLAERTVGVAEVFRWNLGQLQGMCFTRESIAAVGGFDPAFAVLEDLDLVLRVAARFPAVFLEHAAFRYRRHPGGASHDRVRLREASIRLAEKLVDLHPEVLDDIGRRAFQRRQARRYARLAATRLEQGDVIGARSAMARARALAPINVRYRLRSLWLRLHDRS
ncbi:MAG: glycosyltransferase family 2 protein [Candidatus Binatia bacterium]